MNNMIAQYIRDRKNNPIGLVVATSDGHTYSFGWSHVNRKAGDRFDKKLAMEIACRRADATKHSTKARRPHAVVKLTGQMIRRAEKYFKNQTLIVR